MSRRKLPDVSVSRRELSEVHEKLDRLDEAIRGNGRPGLRQRLERLEEADASRRRLTWIVVGAFISAGASAVFGLIQVLSQH